MTAMASVMTISKQQLFCCIIRHGPRDRDTLPGESVYAGNDVLRTLTHTLNMI